MEQLYSYSEIDRDPVDRTISVSFYALSILKITITDLIKDYDAQWFSVSEVPNFIFDHDEMVRPCH